MNFLGIEKVVGREILDYDLAIAELSEAIRR